MKTLFLPLMASVLLHATAAQNELVSATGVPPHINKPETEKILTDEPAVSASPHTIDDMAIIHLGKGFRKSVILQVLAPGTTIVINKEIPAGLTRLRIDLAGLENGTYTIRIKMDDAHTWVKQVVKE